MALVGATGGFGGIEGSNSIARLLVVISGTSAPLSSALSSAEKSMSGFGASASSIGSAMTRSVTLPLLAIGGAALSMAVQFESSLGRIAGLTPILETTGKSIDQIGQELLDLSKTVPTGPVELADALYFAGSAGLSAAQAMDVVKLSAKGAAIGMGSAADISKVLIFALNNYGSAAFDAGRAMDALTVAIKEGTAEPEEMAVALGRLLPVAKEAGVTFEEVVGSVAALTNVGFPARVATTSLRALFSELLSPTIAATDALRELGLTSQDVANQLRVGGPIAAFQLLEKATHGDDEALHDIIPQIRGFSAFLALTNNQMKATRQIFDAVTHSTGALDKAFAIISQTPAFKFQVGLNKLKVAGIEVGEKLIPPFIKIAEIIGDIGDAISGLPDVAQSALADLILVGAAIGPMFKLVGALTEVTKGTLAANAAGTKIVPTFKALSTGFILFSIAALAAVGGFKSLASGSSSLFSVLTTLIGSIIAAKLAFTGLQLAINAGVIGTNALSLSLASISGGALTAIAIGVGAIVTGVALFIGQSKSAARITSELSGSLLDAATSGQTFKQAIDQIKDGELRQVLTDLAKANGLLEVPVGEGFAQAMTAGADDASNALTNFVDKFGAANDELGRGFLGGADQDFLDLAKAIDIAAQKNISLGEAAKEVGIDINDVVGELHNLGQGLGPLSKAAQPIDGMVEAFQALARSNEDYQAEQLGTIAATASSSKAVQDYANKLGVSAEYLSGRLQEFGVDAGSAGAEVKRSFQDAAFTASDTGETISAAMAEAQDAVAESVSGINDSLRSGFTLFEKVDDKVKATTAKLISLAEAQSRSVLQEAANLRILAERGVPADLLAHLADEGPGVVEKFVNASKSQLRRLETAYALGLGAIDDDILNEAAHQEVKGHNMVADFATAILSSSNLPVEAAHKLVESVGAAVARGDLQPSALKMVSTFVNGLGTVRHLSDKEGAKAAQAFAQGLLSGNIVDKAGHIIVRKLVQVLQTSGGLSKAQAQKLGEQIGRSVNDGVGSGSIIRQIRQSGRTMGTSAGDGVRDKKENVGQAGKSLARAGYDNLNTAAPQFEDAGHLLGQKFATGLGSEDSIAAAEAAATDIANHAKTAFDAALKNSPEYFTYYMGKKLGTDFQRGIDDGSHISGFRPKVNTSDVRGAAQELARSNQPPKIVDEHVGTQRSLYEKRGIAAAEAFAHGLVSGDTSDKAGRAIVGNLSGALRDGAQAARSKGSELGSKMGDAIKQGVGKGEIVRAIRESGRTMGTSAAEGIKDKSGAVGDSGKAIGRAGVATFSGAQGAYKQAGVSLGAAFASGLASASGLAQQAAARIANDARAAFDAALKNSPEFFTFYMGKKLAEDLQRGLDAGQPVKGFRPKVDTQDIDRATKPKPLAGVPRKRHTTRAKPTVEQRKIHYINQPKARPVVEVRKVRYIDKPVPRVHTPHAPKAFRPKRQVTPLVKGPSHRIAAPKHIDKPPAPKVDVRVPRPKVKPPAVPKPPSVNVVAKPVVRAAPPAHIAKPRRAPRIPTHHIAKPRRVPKPLTHHEPRKPRLVVEAPPIERKTKPPLVVKPVVNHIDKPRREPKAPTISRREAKPRHVVKPNVTHHVAKPPRHIEKTPSVKLTVQPPPAKETRGISHSERPRHVETKGIHHRDRPQFLERERHHKRRDKTTLDVHIGREKFNRELNYSVRASGR